MRLSNPVLGAFCKYPHTSREADPKKRKYGVMFDDWVHAKQIFKKLGLRKINDFSYCRHPLALIMEAADDICYRTTDIEDAAHAGVITLERAIELLKPIGQSGGKIPNYDTVKLSGKQDILGYLRSGAISSLMDEVVNVFVNNQDDILNGSYTQALLDKSRYANAVNEIQSECKKSVYIESQKLFVEQAGATILSNLLDIYSNMIEEFISCKSNLSMMNERDRGLIQTIPIEIRDAIPIDNSYRWYLYLVELVSGMSDKKALHLHQKLTATSPALDRMY